MEMANRITRTVPELQNGDHLTVAEFRRRYEAMPHVKKAELIEGVVYLGSPVRIAHSHSDRSMGMWLGTYQLHTPGTAGGPNATVRLEEGENEPQPDECLYVLQEYGGHARVDEDGYLAGSPELAAEIALSSVSLDLHKKLFAYERNGIREYVVWRVEDEAIDWFVLRGNKYRPLKPDADGVYRSKIFPGLWLDAKAMIAEDMQRVFQVLQQGIAAPEHDKFVAKLKAKKKS